MTTTIIITICILLLAGYVFDITAARTKVPAVILLLALGWGMRQIVETLDLQLPHLATILPILGTIGLILIVLEGSLELDFDRSKFRMLGKASAMALVPMLLAASGIGTLAGLLTGASFLTALTNAIPLAVISSAIAIPSTKAMDKDKREFVTYESSLSDIFGVMLFNFVALNQSFGADSFGTFGLHLGIVLAIGAVATVGLAFLLSRLRHHVKFAPIVVLTILIYAVGKHYHLPVLIMILTFGMFLGNLDRLAHIKWIAWLRPETLELEVHKLKELVAEGAFLLRTLFFLLFGFQINNAEILDLQSLLLALVICIALFSIRALFLWLLRLDLRAFLFIAPRGLITVLLFLSIPADRAMPAFNNGLVMQVVLISSLAMMLGAFMKSKTIPPAVPDVEADATPQADEGTAANTQDQAPHPL